MKAPHHQYPSGTTFRHLATLVALLASAALAPAATRTWTGLSSFSIPSPRWSNPANWSGGVPQAGDDLVFPSGGLIRDMRNDLARGTAFRSLRFEDSGYQITGNSISLTAGLSFTGGSGQNRIYCHINLLANQTFRCDADLALPVPATMVYYGAIDMDGFNLNLAGLGRHVFAHSLNGEGSSVTSTARFVEYTNQFNNTYTGPTTVFSQFFRLASHAANEPRGLNGPLIIGPGGSSAVQQLISLQMNNPTLPVTIDEGAEWNMSLGVRDTIGSLTMRGGRLSLANWQVTTAGDILVLPAGQSSVIEGDPARDGIGGQPGMLFVSKDPTFIDVQSVTLDLAATLTDTPQPPENLAPPGPDIIKVGSGTLLLSHSNGFAGDLRIRQGRVHVRHPEALGLISSKTFLEGPTAELLVDSTALGLRLLEVEGEGLINSRGQSRCDCIIHYSGELRIESHLDDSKLSLGNGIGGIGTLRLAARNSRSRIVLDGSEGNAISGSIFVDTGKIQLMKGAANGAFTDELTIGNATDPAGSASVELLLRPSAPTVVEQIADDAGVFVNASGTLVVANGAERIGSLAGSGDVSLAASRLTAGGNDRSTTFSGILLGSGGYTKEGLGTNRLTGNNTYTDDTFVNHGTLVVNGQQPASTVTVQTAGTLRGTGRVGDLLVHGRLGPGEGLGRLTCSDFAFTSSGTFEVQLQGTSAGVNHDQLRVVGQVVNLFDARLLVTLGYTPAAGDSFVIIDNDGTDAVVGTFRNLPEGGSLLVNGRRLTITYQGGTGNDVVLTAGPLVLAGSKIWSGAVNGRWSIAGNWLGNQPPENGDDLIFPVGAVRLRTTNDLSAGLLVDTITFERGGFGIAGNEFALNTALISTNSGTVQANEILADLELLNSVNVHVQSGLVIMTNVLQGPGGLAKNGPATLRLAGAGANTYLDRTLVRSGVLELHKSSGFAVPANTSIEIGQTFGFAPYTRNVFVRHFRNNQMSVTSPVIINGTGVLDLNGFDDDIGVLTLRAGAVQTGAGTLFMARDLIASGALTFGPYIPANISGSMDLGTAPRRFTVGPLLGSIPGRVSLQVSAAIAGSAGLIKSGSEAMELSGTSTFTGAVGVEQGLLIAAHSSALGATTGGVTVSGSGTLELADGVNVGAEALTLDRPASGAALQVSAGSASWAGPVALRQNVRIRVHTNSTLMLSGVISQTSGAALGLAKDGPGNLELLGQSLFFGMTTVEAGKLRLHNTGDGVAIAGDLTVGIGLSNGLAVAEAIGNSQFSAFSRVVVNGEGLMDWSGIGANTDTIESLAGRGQVRLGSARISTGGHNDSTAFDGYISGIGGRLTKAGTGRFTLSGPNTYSGVTFVDAGEMRINGYQPSSPLTLTPGGILSGIGTVGPITGTGGTLAPGAEIGTLTTVGNLVLSANDTFHVQVRGTSAGQSDQLVVNGTCNLGGARLQLDLAAPLLRGQRLVILRNDGLDPIVGRFGNLSGGTLCTCAGELTVNYQGGDGNDVEVLVSEGDCSFLVTDLQAGDNQITLCWESVPGRKYRVEQAFSADGPWFPLVESVTANGASTCHSWPRVEGPLQFTYRVALICD